MTKEIDLLLASELSSRVAFEGKAGTSPDRAATEVADFGSLGANNPLPIVRLLLERVLLVPTIGGKRPVCCGTLRNFFK
ncbi:hypothetical protein SLA2020_069950 [Shorea laevis]